MSESQSKEAQGPAQPSRQDSGKGQQCTWWWILGQDSCEYLPQHQELTFADGRLEKQTKMASKDMEVTTEEKLGPALSEGSA